MEKGSKSSLPLENPLEYIREAQGVERLRRLMEVLRSPEGCPWDREQTFTSLLPYLFEEAHEYVEAVGSGSRSQMVEELGDLLLQVVFHARILEEEGKGSLSEIAEACVEKLIARHPHVFGQEKVGSAEEVLSRWEARKRKERKGILEHIPPSLPALLKAYKVGERAAREGLEFEGVGEVMAKLEEEVSELFQAMGSASQGASSRIEEELGDLLFTLVNLARLLGINPELALEKALKKFARRFERMEKPQGSRLDSPERKRAWDEAWEQAKHPPSREEALS